MTQQNNQKETEEVGYLESLGDLLDKSLKDKISYPYGKLIGILIDSLNNAFISLCDDLDENAAGEILAKKDPILYN